MEALLFGWLDYTSFTIVMLVSALVGVWCGIFKRQDSIAEYFLGGRSLGALPVAMSLIASNITGMGMVVIPSDIYAYGSQIALAAFLGPPAVLVVVHCILPVFYKLQCASSFEYLEHRFHKRIRKLTSVLATMGAYLEMPVTMYIPCLAFHQVSGVNVHLVNTIAVLVCVFYTCVGGLRAVVWTDALQLVSLMIATIVVLVASLASVGSFTEIWERADRGGRLVLFDMDPNPALRTTFWTIAIGEGLAELDSLGVAPWSVQRYLALPTLSAAKSSAWMLATGYVVTKTLCYLTGICMYAYYYDCDPIASKVVPHRDNLVPHFLMDVVGGWSGLPGIFIAGVFSAALSTVSSKLNTLSGVLYKDVVEGWLPGHPDERRAALVIKVITLIMGVSIIFMTVIIERLGSIFEVALSLTGFTTGAVFGLFMLGLFVPWAEAVGAVAGAVVSAATMAVVCLGALHAKSTGALRYPELPTRTDGCNGTLSLGDFGVTPAPRGPAVEFDAALWPPFRLSPFYYAAAGPLLTVTVGAAVSAVVRLCNPGSPPTNQDLLSPIVAKTASKKVGGHTDREMDYLPVTAATAGLKD